MADSTLAIAASTCQCLTIVCSLCAYIPQWTTLYRRKSSDDISLKSWVLWIICAALGTFYSITTYLTHGVGLALVFTDLAALCFISVTIGMVIRYRSADRRTAENVRPQLQKIAEQTETIAELVGSISNLRDSEPSESTASQIAAPQH